ncbi:amino acid ABC transporter permease [Streptococcus suis]|uniref:amino acid ABC transporter permease n=1 Tax=Streptococcus suis TaxID=1307 RepID=UPI00192DE75E|nr:amino acid ABC transporter permease [Streptococcus suis]MBL6440180.1 amino acid ABC transporter permease [Streptococcus suis]MBM7283109.1 amino acid ABC transporter permease [Streptococcus suis]MCO8237246.1 amino acid ABC transporter permease [Streptococcus suis]HEM3532115.1 amino acid ABC transporter permease [Streptococcus suis]HEM3589515.1 amino acid ABC transporter permease [Streptococcus suis]
MTERVWQLLLDSFSQILVPGLLVTIPLTILSFTFGLLIAIGTALVQIAQIPILKQVARFYIWVVRGTPLLVQLYVIFFGLPSLGIVLDAFPSAVLVFSVNTGAYAAETIRASIESVPKGQLEAGYSVGMSFAQTMRRIILPQAFRVAFPPLSNTLIGLVKDTSLAANITVLEMFMATQQIAARTYEPFALYCEVALIYLFFSTILTKLQAYGEKKLAVY